ncbi:hypothetical protein EFA46_015165 (plasmid) [Halarchaeum sp. CBA1220]|uniref:hypothetical protein n=1 Tax=Halarchaeum sp. CBA1220 TaxID=1853682 RepID=UPI000F3A97EA|nr:hypothetical protein [Halarchaeum sp. CBA1220]QLC35567.1 hypothetical protein EFA46_015165 [Halarchaeum sp. CBA1220]
MFDSIKSWLSSDDGGDHPLDRPKEDHQVKRREAEQDLEALRSERDELREELEAKREQYEQAKDAGNDEEADDYLRDAEAVKNRLETKRGRIDEVAQQRNFAANMVNIHEMRASHDDEYWRRLKEMDERELTRMFSKQEMEVDEMVGMLERGGDLSDQTVGSYREKTQDMHRASDLEEKWRQESTEPSVSRDPDAIFEDIEETSDERSGDDLEMT